MNKKAFTLIELLVVVLIIGILAAIAVPQYQKAVGKSRASQAIIVLKSLLQAEESFYLANGHYTNNLAELDIIIPPGTAAANWAEFNSQNPNEYAYSCSENGCVARSENKNLPLFHRSKTIYWCIGKDSQWFGKITQQASDICLALGATASEYPGYYAMQ